MRREGMRREDMICSVCRAVCWGVPALLLCLASGPVSAVPAVLRVRPLRDAGGEAVRELPARLTTALTRFLRDHADPTLRIVTAERSEQEGERAPAARYALEGELSYASGADEESGRYLLVARLVRAGRPSALIGQWAGSSSSLRCLTANLRNDPRVHTLGLIGEIGSRVLAAVAADAAGPGQRWRTLYARLPTLRASKVTILQAEAPYALRTDAAGGDTIRLRLQIGTDVRAVCLLTSGPDGSMAALPLSLTAGAGEPLRNGSADSQAVHLPDGIREAWLLCRSALPERGAADAQTYRRFARFCTPCAEEDDAPVHVLNGVGRSAPGQNEALTILLEEIARDLGAWHVLRLHVTTPHK